MLRTRRVENLRHGALTTTAGTREGSTITATASPHRYRYCTVHCTVLNGFDEQWRSGRVAMLQCTQNAGGREMAMTVCG